MMKTKAVSPQAGRFSQLSCPVGRGDAAPGKRIIAVTTRIMNMLLGAVALGLAIAGGNIAADATVRLPAEQISGMPSLAPLLNQVKATVVTVAITGRPGLEKNSGQRPRRAASTRDLPADRQIRATGSGVIIDAEKGLIFTNNHVINGADDIIVTLGDGREAPAKRVGSDPSTDVAVIKVQAENLTALLIDDSDGLEVGDFVLAIGNPYRIGQTVTSGIISGLHRTNVGIEKYEDFIQTDAAIYPGNSGGALVNLRGELIGINTAFIGATNTNPGMGFAIPINMVRFIADQLLKNREVRRGRLGVTFDDVTPTRVRGLKPSALVTAPMIVKVEKGSPAEGAGLKAGDVVSELARISVRDTSDLHNRMWLLSVGDVADLTVVRNGKSVVIRATVVDQDKNIRSK
jgi:S1-C subfamily serine protease